MTSHELAKKLLEGPDRTVVLKTLDSDWSGEPMAGSYDFTDVTEVLEETIPGYRPITDIHVITLS